MWRVFYINQLSEQKMTIVISKLFKDKTGIELAVSQEGFCAYDTFRELSRSFENGGDTALQNVISKKKLQEFVTVRKLDV